MNRDKYIGGCPLLERMKVRRNLAAAVKRALDAEGIPGTKKAAARMQCTRKNSKSTQEN